MAEYEAKRKGPKLIHVQATDNFRVKLVRFTLFCPDGSKLEEGKATQSIVNGYDRVYTTKLRIIAKNIPDNMVVLEVVAAKVAIAMRQVVVELFYSSLLSCPDERINPSYPAYQKEGTNWP